MRINPFPVGILAIFVVFSALSCTDRNDSPNAPTPRQMDSGFEFQRDAFVFENYGGNALGPELSPALMGRMFGAETVCLGGELPCELNPVAEMWMETTNATLLEGRSEGFAVTSLLFHAGVLDPNDFGGETVGDLRLFGNRALQDELSYWAATQAVPSAVQNDRRFAAKDVIPFLAEALEPDAEKHYRLAIAQRTETGFARGHAVTPIGYYKGEGDVYWLRIYDNNFPDRERRIEINPRANTWRYEVPPLDDGEPIVYEGTADNGNYLYFSAVEDRLGVLQPPFAPDSETITISYSTLTLVASRDGQETGIRDGEVLESGDDRVVPAFSACPRCGADVPIIHQTLVDAGVQKTKVIEIKTQGTVSASGGSNKRYPKPSDGVDYINASGPNYSTSVNPRGDSSNDSVTFSEGGSTSYTSRSGLGVKIGTSTVTEDGDFLSFSVNSSGSGDSSVEVKVSIVTDENGQATVEIEGLPAGKQVEVIINRIDKGGDNRNREVVTFKSTGETSRAVLKPGDDKLTVENGDEVSGGNCANGIFEPEFETDLDCGGECNGCIDGESCDVDADCDEGTCIEEGEEKLCRAAACYDGVRNGDETDVDCGGPLCGSCTATVDNRTTPMCSVASDCDNGTCIDGRCRIRQQVIARANRVPAGGTTLRYTLDSGYHEIRLQADSVEGPHEWVLGESYLYNVRFVFDCSTNFDTQYTGITSDSDTELKGVIELDCPSDGSSFAFANLRYQFNLAEVPENDPMTVEFTIDGTTKTTLEMAGAPGTVSVAPYTSTWSARVTKNPLGAVAKPNEPGVMGSYACEVLPWQNDNGAPDFNIRTALVFCEWAQTATCSDSIRNQDESDVDCGGVCTECARTRSCFADSDCVSDTRCVDGTCSFTGTCTDTTLNQDETDVDCGGVICGGCATNQSCLVAADCVSSNCQSNVCQAATCSDSIVNQDETDVDCGGATCTTCALGSDCNVDGDCTDSGCVGNVCTETCSDGALNQDETDVDCGGATCSSCADGLTCTAASDCASNYCLAGTCTTPTCTDLIQNQDETDIDCGGTTCGACADSQACSVASDCTSNYCVANVCTTATCSDSAQNQDETDVDCGGATCSGCAIGDGCSANTDCASSLCTAGTCAESCSDGILNQDETGIDCGGSICGGCGTGTACTLDSDCSTDNCECAASSGNCASNSGTCGAARLVVDQPTTDGVTVSGSFTVPAQCTQVYVQAWGAAGGSGSSGGGMMLPGTAGGAGGYVSGTLNVAQGDVIDVWVGQGGDFGVVYDFGGTPGIGSKYGVETNGGLGDGDSFTGGGGGGGGLTSVRLSGSTTQSFVIPAGGGGTDFGPGDDVAIASGGGAFDSNGEDAPIASQEAGGGAGEIGGSYLGTNGGAAAGTYDSYPMSFMTADGTNGTPANTSAPDYSSCEGIGMGSVGAGSNPMTSMFDAGGDGCVVLRCVGQ